MSWAELQARFATALTHNDAQHRQTLAGQWAGPEYAIEIYRNNYLSSLVQVLRDNFPKTRAYLGDEFFDVKARLYVCEYGCSQPCVSDYGDQFPYFLEQQRELESLRYVPDFARFEQQMHLCAQLPIQEKVLDSHTLASLSEQSLQLLYFELVTHSLVYSANSPVVSLYRFAQNPQQAPSDLNLSEASLLMKQSDFSVDITIISDSLFKFLNYLQKPARLTQIVNEFDHRASELLLEAIALNCIGISALHD